MITRRNWLKTLCAALPAAAAGTKRANILFITADDLGLQLGCYGETRIRTPNLDRFAESAVRFDTAYVAQASCSPSRSAMFTGLYPHANGQYGLANAGFSLHPPLRTATIPAVLKKAGYRTGIIGKLHVEPEASFPFDLRDTNNAATRTVRVVAPKAGKFMQASDEPFFLMVNYSDPHAFRREDDRTKWYFPPQVDGLPERPIMPGPKDVFPFQQVEDDGQWERVAGYYNAIQRLDYGLGLLLEALEKSGKADNTLVVFIGDHGPPFARGKTTVYEAGLRIPFLVRWPGVSKAGRRQEMVSTVDIAPTIYDAAGVTPPIAMHGRSLRSVVGSGKGLWREYLAGEFHFHGASPFYPRRAIRDSRYKLIHNLRSGSAKPSTGIDGDRAFALSRMPRYEGTPARRAFDTFANPPEFELYDLSKDPVEFNNLAGKPELKRVEVRMKQALLEWRRQTDDPFLDPAMIEEYSKWKNPAG